MTTMRAVEKWLESAPDGVCRTLSVDVNVWQSARVVVRLEAYWIDAKSDELKTYDRTARGKTLAQALRKLKFPKSPVRPVKLSRLAQRRARHQQKHMWKHTPCGYTGSTGGAGGTADETCPKCGYDVEDQDVNYFSE